jgi:hypothetical protein
MLFLNTVCLTVASVTSYAVAFAEELGTIRCGAIPMAIGVQSDMATPALARFGRWLPRSGRP